MKSVFAECHRLPLFAELVQQQGRAKILSLLENELQNLPLAVRFLSHQLARGGVSLDNLCTAVKAGDDRDEDDERAAGRVHVRGFYFVVRCALEVLQNNKAALHLCAALSLFPASGVSKRFLHLVGSEQGFDEHEKERALKRLTKLRIGECVQGRADDKDRNAPASPSAHATSSRQSPAVDIAQHSPEGHKESRGVDDCCPSGRHLQFCVLRFKGPKLPELRSCCEVR